MICTIDECRNMRQAKGLCAKHYRRVQLHGDANVVKIRPKSSSRLKDTPEYRTYRHMLGRCRTKTNKAYKHYGGRGIKVCDRWLEPNGRGFDNFLFDMGKRPTNKTSLDRINNNGNYEPSNCRWADSVEQLNNTRRSRFITAYGKTQTVSQWARELGMKSTTIHQRLAYGWTGEKILIPTWGAR